MSDNTPKPTGYTMQIATVIDMTNAKKYKKSATVLAQMITNKDIVWLANGKQDLEPGDFLIVDPGVSVERPAKVWGCKREFFFNTYEPVESGHVDFGRFRKKALIRGMELTKRVLLNIIDSDQPEFGNPGDWLVCNLDPDGNPMRRGSLEDRYIIRQSEFPHLYEEVAGEEEDDD